MKPLRYYFRKIFLRESQERRRHLRKPISLKVTNQQSGFFTYYISTDISAGGMFLRAEEPLLKGTMLDLEFSLPNSSNSIQTSAEVVRSVTPSPDSSRESGMGIRFISINEKDREEIDSFVKQTI
jgi:type IV pilus assembly protein PilZ